MRIVNFRGMWCAVFSVDGKRFRRSLGRLPATPENYPAAQRALVDLERALSAPDDESVGGIVTAYLDDSKAVTIDYMRWMWGRLAPHCAGLRVDQIDKAWCRKYVAARKVAAPTARKEIAMLGAAFKWAGRSGHSLELPAASEPRNRFLTKTEFHMLLDAAAPNPHLVMFLHLAIATGARKEALLALTWPQVYFDRRQIWLGTKAGGKARAIVPITDTLMVVLKASKPLADQLEADRVVHYNGAPVGDIKKAFATAVKNAGLKDVTPHDLRHTAAVWMAESGIPMAEIAQFLGHSDPSITYRVYARYSPDYLRGAAAALELNQ